MPGRYIEVQPSEGRPKIIRLEPKSPVVVWMAIDQMQARTENPTEAEQNVDVVFGKRAGKSLVEVRPDNSITVRRWRPNPTEKGPLVFQKDGNFKGDIPVFMQDENSIKTSPKKATIKYGDPPKP